MERAKLIVKKAYDALSDKKGEDIKVIEIGKLSTVADYFIIANGSNAPHVESLVDNVEEELLKENERLKSENEALLLEIKTCRDDLNRQIAVMTSVKKDIRRYEVQLNSLKTENAEFKRKFAMIENNPIGRFALKIYRWLKEMMRRRG